MEHSYKRTLLYFNKNNINACIIRSCVYTSVLKWIKSYQLKFCFYTTYFGINIIQANWILLGIIFTQIFMIFTL